MFNAENTESPGIKFVKMVLPSIGVSTLLYIAMAFSPLSFAKNFIAGVRVLNQAPVANNIDHLGNYSEALRGFDNVTQAIKFINFSGSFKTSIESRGEIDADLKNISAQDPAYAKELKDFNAAITHARSMNDPYARAEFINGYINSSISYDYEKADRDDRHSSSIKEIMQKKHDICFAYALRKYDALLRVGFSPDDVELVRVGLYNGTFNVVDHAVTGVKIDGKSYILEQTTESGNSLIPADYYFDPSTALVDGLRAVPEMGINENGAVLFKKDSPLVIGTPAMMISRAHNAIEHGQSMKKNARYQVSEKSLTAGNSR